MSEVGDKIVLIPGCHCCSSHLSIYHCPRLDLKDRTVGIRKKTAQKSNIESSGFSAGGSLVPKGCLELFLIVLSGVKVCYQCLGDGDQGYFERFYSTQNRRPQLEFRGPQMPTVLRLRSSGFDTKTTGCILSASDMPLQTDKAPGHVTVEWEVLGGTVLVTCWVACLS